MMESTSEIMNRGMNEKFDYTKWQRDYFDAKTPMEIGEENHMILTKQKYTIDDLHKDMRVRVSQLSGTMD